jgi:hypothetical protein
MKMQAHHEESEKLPTFKACIDALSDYYKEFVVRWHIAELKPRHELQSIKRIQQ